MDTFQERAIGNHERRHRDTIRKAAEEIREYADYILRDVDKGHTSSKYAGTVLADAQEIVKRFAMRQHRRDVIGILTATED